jgi:hypothetical protein
VAGEDEPGNRGGRAGGRGEGSGSWATGGRGGHSGSIVEGGTGQPGRESAKADRPPKRKLRRAMTLVEMKANAPRSIGGGSPSDPAAFDHELVDPKTEINLDYDIIFLLISRFFREKWGK